MNNDTQNIISTSSTHRLNFPFSWKKVDLNILSKAGFSIEEGDLENDKFIFTISNISSKSKGVILIKTTNFNSEGLLNSLVTLCTEILSKESERQQVPGSQAKRNNKSSKSNTQNYVKVHKKTGDQNSPRIANNHQSPFIHTKILISAIIFFSFSKILNSNFKGSGPPSSRGKTSQLEPILKYLLLNLNINSFEINGFSETKIFRKEVALLMNESLRALATFLFDRSILFTKYFPELSEILSFQSKKLLPQSDHEANKFQTLRSLDFVSPRLALNCISSVCYKAGFKFEPQTLSNYISLSYQILNEWSQISKNSCSKKERFKILKSAICAIQTIIKEDKRAFKHELKDLISILFKLSQFDFLNFSHESSSYLTNESGISSEQNVLTDSETELLSLLTDSKIIINHREILRCLSMKTLKLLIENYRSQTLTFWENLLPRENFITEKSLLYVILNDPSPIVRVLSLDVLNELMVCSSKYLAMSISRNISKTSFSSLSDTLGATIVQVHHGISLAILNEETNQGLTYLFKICDVLFRNCLYKQIGDNYAFEIMKSICRILTSHSDYSIQILSWKTCYVLMRSDLSDSFKEHILNGTSLLPNEDSLVETTKKLIYSDNLSPALRSEIISFAIILIEFGMISWSEISTIAENYLFDNSHNVRASILKLVIAFAKYTQVHKNEDIIIETWTLVLDDFLGPLSNDDSSDVRAVICNGLEILGASVFEQLNDQRQLFGITLLLGFTEDENHDVRAIAFGALGQFVRFPFLKEDLQFLIDVSNLSCNGVSDSNLDVKVRSSWCLANACDVLFSARNKLPKDILLFDKNLASKIARSGIAASEGHDKIKWNGVRVLGSLVGSGLPSLLGISNFEFLKEVCQAVKINLCSGPLKARWNSCRAIKNMHENCDFPPTPTPTWYLELIDTVIAAIVNCKNFKVKVSGLAVLSCIKKDSLPNILDILNSLLDLINQLSSIEASLDFQELTLFPSFVEQLLATYYYVRDLSPLDETFLLREKKCDYLNLRSTIH